MGKATVDLGVGFWLTENDRMKFITRTTLGNTFDVLSAGRSSNTFMLEYLRRMRVANRMNFDAFARAKYTTHNLPGTENRIVPGGCPEGLIGLQNQGRGSVSDWATNTFMEAEAGGRFNFEAGPRTTLHAEASFGRRFNHTTTHEKLREFDKTKNVLSISAGVNVRLGSTQDQFRSNQIRRMQSGQRGRSHSGRR